jgi:hypothetical protein
MAVLRAHSSEERLILPDRCLVGRSKSCDLVLGARDVSGRHAEIQWDGDHWELHDLGSRNGTCVDGARLAAGERLVLRQGAEIRFGRESAVFNLEDAAGPQLMAHRLPAAQWRVGEGGYLALPDLQEPECSIYQDPHGSWICERGAEIATIDDRAVLALRDGLWRVYVPKFCAGTWQESDGGLCVANLRLCFAFSRDEERVELVACCGDRRLDLQRRAHHYVLLLLARRRLADERAGVPAAEQGWLTADELLKMLRMDDNHLNICIHRARTQLGRLGVADAASLVERRPGTRQIRLGPARIELRPLD